LQEESVMEDYRKRGEIPVTGELRTKMYERAGPSTPELKPGEPLPLWSTELFQSIEPGFIILLTPLIILMWAGLRRRGVEPSPPGKMLLGLLTTGASTAMMVLAVHAGSFGVDKVSPLWL